MDDPAGDPIPDPGDTRREYSESVKWAWIVTEQRQYQPFSEHTAPHLCCLENRDFAFLKVVSGANFCDPEAV